MGKLWLQNLPLNYDEQELREFLKENNCSLLKGKGNKNWYIERTDALKSANGLIVVIVDKNANYENLSTDILVANKSVSTSDLIDNFYETVE